MSEDRDEGVRMIRDSAAGIAPRTGDFRRIRARRFIEPGFDRAVFREMCQMGWLGLMIPEAAGGSGLGTREFCALTEELGASLVPEPLIGAAMAARLLPESHLAEVLSGDRIVLPAWQEGPHSLEVAAGGTVAGNGTVTGKKLFVAMAAGADAFLVTTTTGLALVERGASGTHLEMTQTQDGGGFGTLTLDNAPAEIFPGDASEALETAVLATSAYLLGCMDRVFGVTLEYLKTREQFGRKIGSFQALQHRSADLRIQLSLTRAVVEASAAKYDSASDPAVRKAAVSRAKARASDAAGMVTRGCIQLHGGIGYTDAADPGLFLRKMMVLAPSYGSASLHRARFRALAPESDED
ncbi:acyl-CoA dehydrogenase family protein [Acidisphaera sp. S103]|uniref:acyl-CoA dehydrogenase family protein n=1 Tax=Acidisphaera sp. S103 TaxID=1747223 RepID=UPI00131C9C1F|nr:acyl-CoA dehydrogenase family protein [Acidisphaera sp. S103]